jgi:hypothetical protein
VHNAFLILKDLLGEQKTQEQLDKILDKNNTRIDYV